MRVHMRLAKNECGHDSGNMLYTHVWPSVANHQSPVLALGANLEIRAVL